MAFQIASLYLLGFDRRFISLFAATVFVASQAYALNAGEKEAIALAKLLPSEQIAIQQIKMGLPPEELEFTNAIWRRGEKAMKENPELQLRMKDHAELVKRGARSRGSLPEEVVETLGLSAAELAKLALILNKGDFPIHPIGPTMNFQVQRADNTLTFRQKHDVDPVQTDSSTVMIERLLSNLELSADASSAQLLGVTIGPAKWVDTTQDKNKRMNGKGKGLEWLGRGLRPSKALIIAGKQIEDTPIQVTVSFKYMTEYKMTICSIAIGPEGAKASESEGALFMVASASAIPRN